MDRDLHYAVVVDAGSSGSRAYLYAWPTHSGNPHELLNISPLTGRDGNPVLKKVTPGLSSLRSNPEGALAYITPLMEFAMSHIPAAKLRETPLYILATAGMRLLAKSEQDAIVSNLRRGIQDKFDFLFPEGNLEIITGKQEGKLRFPLHCEVASFHKSLTRLRLLLRRDQGFSVVVVAWI